MSRHRTLRAALAALLLSVAAGARAGSDTPTVATSRQVTMHLFGSRPTIATSRQVTLYLNFRVADAADALRFASGLSAADPAIASIYNVVGPGDTLDMNDAAEILRLATGLDHRM